MTIYQSWVGKTQASEDQITLAPAAGLAATLDWSAQRLNQQNNYLPELWHWLYHLPRDRQSDLGNDGHAKKGGFLPPIELPRRMWAGSRMLWFAPLKMQSLISRTSTIESVSSKSGKSGELVFVTVRHELFANGSHQPALIEHHDIVYRGLAQEPLRTVSEIIGPQAQSLQVDGWRKRIHPTDVMLFRYSALTFNGHRIHYDRHYCENEEGYPGLVVHGPLIATLMVDLLREKLGECRLKSFSFKALSPLIDVEDFEVCAQHEEGGRFKLWAQTLHGRLAMLGEAQVV